MTTKPPSPVQESAPTSLENIAYASVSAIPVEQPNDRNRLGYHVWRWLTLNQGTLEQAVAESGSRLQISKEEAVKIVAESLKKQGVSIS